jgi:acyl carrier protein
MDIESEFSIEIDEEFEKGFKTVADVVQLIMVRVN